MALTNLPSGRNGMIEFYKEHHAIWSANSAALNLTPAAAAEVSALTEQVLASLAEANLARNAAKAATARLNAEAALLRAAGGAAVATIRAFADTTGDPAIYQIAKIAPPSPPTPVPAPTSPTSLTARPNADGTITLAWKGTVTFGQTFDIERSVDNGPYTLLANRRGRNYLDSAVPMNSAAINYRLYGLRGGRRSESPATTTVLFGNLPAPMQAVFRSAAA